jgi:arylsulfatase A-like enzyme
MPGARLHERLLGVVLTNFWAGLAALAAVKLGFIAYHVASPSIRGVEPAYKYIIKAPFLFGGDVLGAATLAILVALLCAPFELFGKPRLSTALSIVVQWAHGVFALASTLCAVYLGGPLNKQAIDLAASSAPPGSRFLDAGMRESISIYVNAPTVLALIGVSAVAIAAVLFAPRLYPRLTGRRLKVVVIALAAEAAVTMGVMPFLVSGEIWGIRIPTYGLEKSAVLELGRSYAKSGLAARRLDMSLVRDEFRYDFSGMPPVELGPPSPLRKAVPKRTNVVFVALESVGAPYLAGDTTPMPFLRDLGERPDAHRLANHYSTWSLTTKAFFSLFCAELPYPHYESITTVNPSIPCRSLSEVLHDAGYYTAYVTGADQAYDRKERFFKHRKFDEILDMKNMPGRDACWKDAWGLDERTVVKNLLDVAAHHEDEPFFIFYEVVAGHHPFLACAEHEKNPLPERFENYKRTLGFVDDRVREIAEGLERLGLADDTLLVVMSDHGDGHGRYEGRNVWQPVIQVPVVLVGPQLASAHGETDFVTSHLDIAPTILGLLGIDVPCTMKGRNLLVDGSPRIALFGGRPPKFQLGLADGRWKFIWEDREVTMLFDLRADPKEERNLADENKARVEFYERKIDEWSAFSTNLIEDYATILSRSGCTPKK